MKMCCGVAALIVAAGLARGLTLESGPARLTVDIDTWEVYPLAQRIAHDKCVFFHHDLGKFVTGPAELAWTLGLGFNMSYRMSAQSVADARTMGWLAWIDRIQKSVCARATGEPVGAFEHRQSDTPFPASNASPALGPDDGAMRAEIWIFARPGEEAAAELPPEFAPPGGRVTVTLDGGEPVRSRAAGGVLRLTLPPGPDPAPRLWHAAVAPAAG